MVHIAVVARVLWWRASPYGGPALTSHLQDAVTTIDGWSGCVVFQQAAASQSPAGGDKWPWQLQQMPLAAAASSWALEASEALAHMLQRQHRQPQ